MNGVMFQGFHYFLDKTFPESNGRNLWEFLKDEAAYLSRSGIYAVWIPPPYKAEGKNSVGYDVYDHFDLGEFNIKGRPQIATKYGDKTQLLEAITALHNAGIQVYADVVLNHKSGGEADGEFWEAIRVEPENRAYERWGNGFEEGKIDIRAYTIFQNSTRGDKYSAFKWRVKHFDSVDTVVEIRQNGNSFPKDSRGYIYRYLCNEPGYDPPCKNFERWVSLEKGNYDYLTSSDIDFGRYDVREEMKYWGEWLVKELNLDGVRLDAVKHISGNYVREWLGHVRAKTQKKLFAVAEYIASETKYLHEYISIMSAPDSFPQTITLFDFPLRFKFREASWKGELFDLRELNYGILMVEQPTMAVTFVENHDYEYGRQVDSHVKEWFKPLGYAFILLRQAGYPCVFFPDLYGSVTTGDHQGQPSGKNYLELLLKLRQQFALGEERYSAEANVAGWVRVGFVPRAKGAMVTVINNSFNKVKAINVNTGRTNKQFYHLATIKWTPGGFLVVNNRYEQYGDKAQELWTDAEGWGNFPADGGSVSIWLEEGTQLD
ncbi:alpha-amylase [Adhaeribacter arboris]|uniref:Alpha-amylase n=1 Tax=Adhaeribacter arboris TaxID=2072846 RepID=A0A2T2YE65_9BACT|nr:alpha-amylase [Adhaeribacter arboris]PSR53806.1 alpha-amylase [Adhaeribacter arboris]